jgi:Ca2+:H+ antiporter
MKSPLIINNDLHEQELQICVAIIILLVTTAVIGLRYEFVYVGSIENLTATTTVSAKFVGLILLSIDNNAVEHITTVEVASKGRLNLATSLAIGSSWQTALLVISFVTVLA